MDFKMEEEQSDSDILNDIETRFRKNKKVNNREIKLLMESYIAYGVEIPEDIYKKLLKGGFYLI